MGENQIVYRQDIDVDSTILNSETLNIVKKHKAVGIQGPQIGKSLNYYKKTQKIYSD